MIRTLSCFVAASLFAGAASAEEPMRPRTLSLEEFLERAVREDTEFEEILVDALTLRYQRDLTLPPRDFVLAVREELELSFDEGADSATTASLTGLFPMSGTEVSAAYRLSPGSGGRSDFSDVTLTLAQAIAENAFGRSTRLLERIVGLEIEVARYQVIEAYEDYLATILAFYLDWYEAYENLEVGRSSYRENEKLLENMEARRESKIALPIDVNKISLQVLAKKERLVELEERYASRGNLVARVLRERSVDGLVPTAPDLPLVDSAAFGESREGRESSARTLAVFELLERRGALQVERDVDALLPSVDLLLSFRSQGSGAEIRDSENEVLAGVNVALPFRNPVERAGLEVSKVLLERAELESRNIRRRLETDLRNVALALERERNLAEIADQKTVLAERILKDETENYSFAKVTLNDYIDAVNVLDTNRFDQIRRHVAWRKLALEWLRLADRLVSTKTVVERHGRFFEREADDGSGSGSEHDTRRAVGKTKEDSP